MLIINFMFTLILDPNFYQYCDEQSPVWYFVNIHLVLFSLFFAVCQDFRTRKITSNGEHAAEMFSLVERLTPSVVPFTWLFIRPPWATTGACCKECVFKNMLGIVKVLLYYS